MASKSYIVAPGVAITSKGVVLGEGKVVKEADFVDKKSFEALIKAKKIVIGKAEEETSSSNTGASSGGTGAGDAGTGDTNNSNGDAE